MLHNAKKTSRTHADLGRLFRLHVRPTGRRRPRRTRAWPLYPLDAIFMPASPASAEIADLTHCGNILTRCAVTNARRVTRRAPWDRWNTGEKPHVARIIRRSVCREDNVKVSFTSPSAEFQSQAGTVPFCHGLARLRLAGQTRVGAGLHVVEALRDARTKILDLTSSLAVAQADRRAGLRHPRGRPDRGRRCHGFRRWCRGFCR